MMDLLINNFLDIELLPVINYKRFKHQDDEYVSSSCSQCLTKLST